jgi:hypothetical protein
MRIFPPRSCAVLYIHPHTFDHKHAFRERERQDELQSSLSNSITAKDTQDAHVILQQMNCDPDTDNVAALLLLVESKRRALTLPTVPPDHEKNLKEALELWVLVVLLHTRVGGGGALL